MSLTSKRNSQRFYLLIVLYLSACVWAQKAFIAQYDTVLMGMNAALKVKTLEKQKEQTEQAINHAISHIPNLANPVRSWEPASDTSRIDSVNNEAVRSLLKDGRRDVLMNEGNYNAGKGSEYSAQKPA